MSCGGSCAARSSRAARSASSPRGWADSPSGRSSSCPAPIRSSPSERETILRWVAAEEEAFGRALDRGSELLGAPDRRGEGAGDLLGRRRGRVQAPRHVRLSLRPDQGAARRAGPVGGRLRVRGADGEAAGAGADRRRARGARSPRGGAVVRAPRRPASRFVGYETLDADTAVSAAQELGRGRLAGGPGEARGEPLLSGGRRPGRRTPA